VLFDKRQATLIEYPDGASGSYLIPLGVTSIETNAFAYCSSLTDIAVSQGVTSIGDWAFSFCTNLDNVTIAGSATNIGNDAFAQCGPTSVYFTGNAPAADSSVFVSENKVTVYYLPGTTGWNEFSTNTGYLTVRWNPLMQASGPSFGVQNNQFGFNITGTINIPVVVEACTNLASPIWISLQTFTLTNGLVYFSEPTQTNASGRYYRLRSP
jgi:hypothetical protein